VALAQRRQERGLVTRGAAILAVHGFHIIARGALAARRGSLANLRAQPHVALSLLCEGDVAVTVHAVASVVADPMEISDRVCAVALEVVRIQDHGQPRFEIESGVGWRWTDPEAQLRDREVRGELLRIANSLVGDGR
jgi:hypothetical protein